MLTVKEAAELKKVSVTRILQLIKQGTIKAKKFGNVWGIKPTDLEKAKWPTKPGPKQKRR